MSIERKLIRTVDAASGPAVYVEDVFSTWLYSGTGSSQTITNGIDLATKGGLVWGKNRTSGGTNHILMDTARGTGVYLSSNTTTGNTTQANVITAYNTDGFTLGSRGELNGGSPETYASWTFRKQAKFFDVVTYTGNGSSDYASQTIQHNLGSAPGMVIIKATSTTSDWMVRHKSLGSNMAWLNKADAPVNWLASYSSDITSTSLTVYKGSATYPYSHNDNGVTYVAYLFADSNSGGFGPAGTDSVVACGSFTSGTRVSLGWEPQFIISKLATSTETWIMADVMRGMPVTNSITWVNPNTSAAETNFTGASYTPDATGFTPTGFSAGTHIYLAIRRGPMRTPTDATKVFNASISVGGTPSFITNFPVDFHMSADRPGTDKTYAVSRLTGSGWMLTQSTAAESSSNFQAWDRQNGCISGWATSFIGWNFRRAPGFFDVVCYTGTGSARTVAHNLGVAPEFVIYKCRSTGSTFWICFHKDLGTTNTFANYLALNVSDAKYNGVGSLFPSAPSSSVLNLGASGDVNGNDRTYVAYLFATCPGVSKVGSYTGNGSSQTIDCGFASGARFVLIRRTDAAGDWWTYDSARGIVAANDPALRMNSTAAEVTSADAVDPQSSGFIVNQEATCNINVSSATYIYLAIA